MSETEFRARIADLTAGYHRIGLKTDLTFDRLASAVWFGHAHPVASDPVLSRHYRANPPVPQGCYHNCQGFLATSRHDYADYFEGFVASSGGCLVHHGWLVVHGIVFDPTLELAAPTLAEHGLHLERRGYFGIAFPPGEVLENFLSREGKPFLTYLPDWC